MMYEKIEQEVKAILEAVEQGELFYTGKEYNSFKDSVNKLTQMVEQQRESYFKGGSV